jgi:penicillin-binding protein 2
MAGRSQPFKDHWREQRLFVSRVIAAAVIVVLLTGVLVTRLVQLQIIDFQRFSELSRGNQLRIEPLAPTRGIIYDRNGLIIAENRPTWQLVGVPEQIDDVDEVLGELEDLELLDPADHPVLVELLRSHRRFERVTLGNLTEVQAARFAVRRHRLPGIDIQEGLVRFYPYGDAAAHAIGYVGSVSAADLEQIDRSNYAATAQIGKTGIERSYESLLHGEVGYKQQVVNAQGRVLLDPATEDGPGTTEAAVLGGLETRWPVPGRHLVVSLDMRLQLAVQEALSDLRGAAIAIDPRNGDVLALVSTPSFDPNHFAAGISRAEFLALNSDVDKPLFNRALGGHYPPGSTVKPFLGLAALYHEAESPTDHEYCPGFFQLPGSSHRYRDWRPQGHGKVDMHTAIVQSCDVYFYNLAVNLDIDNIATFLKTFGFGSRTGLDINGEDPGLVPSREWKRKQFKRREDQVWFPGETVITGIGQGFTQVTPLQLAHAGAMLAARGRNFKPRLLIGTEDAVTREVQDVEPVEQPGVDDIDAESWQVIHDAMVGVTSEPRGSGYRDLHTADYKVAGKTGTAQVFTIAQEEKYDEETVDQRLRDHRLFFAYAPADAPTIAIAVVVENGGNTASAVPIARKILDAYFETENYVARQP